MIDTKDIFIGLHSGIVVWMRAGTWDLTTLSFAPDGEAIYSRGVFGNLMEDFCDGLG